MNYRIDIKRIIDGNIHMQGWVLPKDYNTKVDYDVLDSKNQHVDFQFVAMKRQDVEGIYIGKEIEGLMIGFDIKAPFVEDEVYKLIIKVDNEKVVEKISKKLSDNFNSKKHKTIEKYIAYFNKNTFKRAFDFLCKEGLVEFIKKTKRKVKGLETDYDYDEWYHLTKISDEELEEQRNTKFEYEPFFSIVIPLYDTEEKFLKLLIDSILNQTYQNFEVCICDATPYDKATHKNNPKKFFESIKDDRIHIQYANENKSIADNTNIAISMAKGDYIVLCDHDDELTLDALYQNAKVLNENRNIEFIYSDEDKVDTKSGTYFEPNFKSDFNIDMLLSVNYICHLSTIKRELLESIKENEMYFRPEFDGAQDYDLFLRIVNMQFNKYGNSKNIYHISKVLYHWRSHKGSTSQNVDSKMYAFENGAKAIEDFINRSSLNFPRIEKVEKGFDYGLYHIVYKLEEEQPLVSVIIPNKDHVDDLKRTIDSITKGKYKNLEIIVVENNSVNEETFEYYQQLKDEKNVKVVDFQGSFNFSKINNFGIQYAKAKYILFLNNDVEMIDENSIFEMISILKRNDVGAVGAKLLYNDDTFQHAGCILGIGGVADHAFKTKYKLDHTYANRAHICQDLSAVTAACLMIKKEVFDEIGGYDEKLEVAFNDIDLCMKIRKIDKLIVYNPYSVFYHYESKSRGLEDTKEKIERFNKETAYFLYKWEDKMSKIDEYYNPNLTLRKNDFSLRNLHYEKIGETFSNPPEIIKLINDLRK